MKYANATCYYYEFTPEEAISHFAASGWENVELSYEHTQDLLQRGGSVEATGNNFIQFAHDNGVNIPQAHLALQIDIVDNAGNRVTDELKRWLDLYMAMGVRSAVLHPGGHIAGRKEPNLTMDGIFERRVEALRILTEHIKGTDMSICLENVGYIGSCEELNALIDPIGDAHLGICLDTGHLNLSYHRADACLPIYKQGHFIRTAGKRLKALHVHDNDGTRDMHVMPYTYGNINFKEVMDALREIGYDGLFNLEIPGEARDVRLDLAYPLRMRYAKSKYLFDLFEVLLNL